MFKTVFVFFTFLGFSCGSFAAGNNQCAPSCKTYIMEIKKLRDDLKRFETLLTRNRDYLRNSDKITPSLALKINSNILIISVKIENFKDKTELLTKQLAKDCKECKL